MNKNSLDNAFDIEPDEKFVWSLIGLFMIIGIVIIAILFGVFKFSMWLSACLSFNS